MAKTSRTLGLYRLLKPHARPHVWKLVAVFFLSAVGAFLTQGSYLFLAPTWEILFPPASAEQLADEARAAYLVQERALSEEAAAALIADMRDGAEATRLDRLAEGLELEPGAIDAVAEELELAAQGGAAPDDAIARAKGWMTTSLVGEEGTATDEGRLRALFRVAMLICVIAILAAAAGYLATLTASRASLEMVVSLRMSLAEHLVGLPLRYHGGRKFGDLLSRMSADVGQTLQVVNIALRELVQAPFAAIMALGWAFVLMPQATLLVLVGLPVLVIPIMLLLRSIRKGSTESLKSLGNTTQVLSQIFTGIRTVKAYRAEGRELERYRAANRTFINETLRMVKVGAISGAWTILYTHIGLAIVVVLVGWLTINGSTAGKGGEMLTFFLLISQAYSHIKKTTRSLDKVAQAQGAYERLQALLDESSEIEEQTGAHVATGLGAGVKLEDVTFTYPGADEPAIDGLTLELRPGETLALVGPSGAGKSTLIDLVARFIDPTAGQVTVDGVDLREVTLDSWTSQFSMVTQAPFLFHTTVLENIRYGKPDATRDEIEAAARAADIHEFVNELSEGYDTDVMDAGARLSGGQRQRITIARAVLHGAPLLLLDEATSALDTESERTVQAALDRLMEGHTAVVIAHRLSTIRNADRIAVLEAGRLVELGTHDELIARDGLYARLHGMQFHGGAA